MKKSYRIKNIKHGMAITILSFLAVLMFPALSADYDKWAAHNPDEPTVIDHSPMSNILKFLTVENSNKTTMAYYLGKGEVLDYIGNYRKYLEKLPVSLLNKDEQLAYWLNLHNVAVIEMLSSNNKLTSKLKKLRGIPGSPGKKWSEKLLTVENTKLSLEEIEQKILLQQWKDPLVLYGIYYSTKGSPTLGLKGFQGPTVKEQLSEIAAQFIGSNKNVKVSKSKAKVTSLLMWHKSELFLDDDKAIIAHLQKYARGRAATLLQNVVEIDSSHKFNWSSNAQRKPRNVSGFGRGGGGGSYGGGS